MTSLLRRLAIMAATMLALMTGPALAQSSLPKVTGESGVPREAGPMVLIIPNAGSPCVVGSTGCALAVDCVTGCGGSGGGGGDASAANQISQLASLSQLNSTVGLTTDAMVGSPGDGSLIALTKRVRDRLEGIYTNTNVFGGTGDAAVTAGASGTMSAKLRLMTTQLSQINTTLGSPLQAGGSVSLSGTLPAFAAAPTVNLGALNGAATEANQAAALTHLATIAANAPLANATRSYNWASGQRLAVTSASAQSAAITATEVTLAATTDMFIAVGASPTATVSTAGSLPLLAGEKLTVKITSGWKVAAIRNTADGALYILPVQ